MPSRRICLRCQTITEHGESYCAKHQPKQRWNTAKQGTLGWEWRKIRNLKLQQTPRCEECGARATTVDHITPRAHGGTHAWSNLRSLCTRCHATKTQQDAAEGRRRMRDDA